MRISEEYLSIQGEGHHVGWPTWFIRVAGCALRCSWCDAAFTWEKGYKFYVRGVSELMAIFRAERVKNMCLTGGEPLLQPKESEELVFTALREGYSVSLETGGDQYVGNYRVKASLEASYPPSNLCICVDYKLPGSGMHERMLKDNFVSGVLSPFDCVKFVLANEDDYKFACSVLALYPHLVDETVVLFHPLGEYKGDSGVDMSANYKWLCERVLADNLPVRVGLQAHKVAWGNARRR